MRKTFFVFTATNQFLAEARQIPTATTPFESTTREGQIDFFGRSGQLLFNDFLALSFDLFQGDAAFKPMDWRLKVTPAFNFQRLAVQELGVVSPDVRKGRIRDRGWATLQEWFGEVKLDGALQRCAHCHASCEGSFDSRCYMVR